MRIGVCIVELHIPGITSLKGKRSVVKSLKERLKARFNVSVAEVGANDVYQRAVIGIAMAGNDVRHLNSELDKLVNTVEGMHVADVIHHEIEIL